MPDFKEPTTEKQERFAKAFGKDLLPLGQAAAKAGYADPNGEIDRLMSNRAVVSRVIEYLRSAAVKWQVLVVKAKGTLLEAMDAKKLIRNKQGEVVLEIDDMKTRLEAARIVLLTLKRDGAHLLEDAAADEDKAAESNVDLARRIVGAAPERPQ